MTTTPSTSPRLGRRLRQSLALAQTRIHSVEERARARWVAIPDSLRTAIDRARDRVRETLDLPSRGDIASLLERVDDLDCKLAALAEARLAALPPAGGDSALYADDAELVDAAAVDELGVEAAPTGHGNGVAAVLSDEHDAAAADSESGNGHASVPSASKKKLDGASAPRTARSKKARDKKRGAGSNGRSSSKKR